MNYCCRYNTNNCLYICKAFFYNLPHDKAVKPSTGSLRAKTHREPVPDKAKSGSCHINIY